MAAGTVGYTDTRSENRDYLGMIAGQISKRVGEASDMATSERQFAADQAEAGGTSLEEAGIGKGYFFGRALGSRFGGDAIARTRGRFATTPTAGINPAGTAASRFRGGFDYNVTNEIATGDTSNIEAALITGLSGVSQGLQSVSQALIKIDGTLGGLERTQMNMARAIMFQGYVNQMLLSQQQQAAGRDSLRKEERSIEGGGFGGGSIGGQSFGGAGGGRGMINVSDTRSGGRPGGGSGGGSKNPFIAGSPGASFATGNIGNIASRSLTTSLSAGKNMVSGGVKAAKNYKAISSGDMVGMIGSNNLYKKYGIDTTEILAKNPSKIAQAATKMVGFGGKEAVEITGLVEGGLGSSKYLDDATKASKTFAELYKNADSTTKKILEADVLAKQFGKEPDAIARGFQSALGNQREFNTMQKLIKKNPSSAGRVFMDTADYNEVYEMVIEKYGKQNADSFMRLGLFGIEDKFKGMNAIGDSVLTNNAIADSLIKNYPDMTYESLEKAVMLARVGNMKDAGMSSTKIVKELREKMGNNVADDLLLKYGDDVLKNSAVSKIFGKGSAKVGLRRVLKAIPGIGLGLGIIFGIQRAMKGDLLGAGLEIGSGVLGLNPATTGLGLGIDGFLLARDMGVMPLKKGVVATGSAPVPAVFGEAGLSEAAFPLEGSEGMIAGSVFGNAAAAALAGNFFATGMNSSGDSLMEELSSSAQDISNKMNQLSTEVKSLATSPQPIINNITNNNVTNGGAGGGDDASGGGGNFSNSGLDAWRLNYLGSLA